MIKKMKGKKKNKIDFSIHLNEDVRKKMGVSQSEIKKTSKEYKVINIWGLQEELILKGKEGQIAYVRHDLDSETDKWKLIVEFPLDLTVEQQRDWSGCASKFFKPFFIKKIESVPSEKDFFDITQKPYKELRFTEFNPAKPKTKTPFVMRSRSYADSAPYASKTTRKQDLEARNEWIKERYKQSKKDKSIPKHIVRYDKISEELVGKVFGNLKITKPLETYTIKNIIYSKPKKISD